MLYSMAAMIDFDSNSFSSVRMINTVGLGCQCDSTLVTFRALNAKCGRTLLPNVIKRCHHSQHRVYTHTKLHTKSKFMDCNVVVATHLLEDILRESITPPYIHAL